MSTPEEKLEILEKKLGSKIYRYYLQLDTYDRIQTILEYSVNIQGIANIIYEYSQFVPLKINRNQIRICDFDCNVFKNKTPEMDILDKFSNDCETDSLAIGYPLKDIGDIFFIFYRDYSGSRKPSDEWHTLVFQHKSSGLFAYVDAHETYEYGSYLDVSNVYYYSTLDELLYKHEDFEVTKDHDTFGEMFRKSWV